VCFPRANPSHHTGEQGDCRSLPSTAPLILGNLASNGVRFARGASEIGLVLLVLRTKPVSFPKRKQHSCYSPFPSQQSARRKFMSDRCDCWTPLPVSSSRGCHVLLPRSAEDQLHLWACNVYDGRPKGIYKPGCVPKPSAQGVSLPQPGPDWHNHLNSDFAVCWMQASSLNAEWRKRVSQRGKAPLHSPLLPSLRSSQVTCTTSSSTAHLNVILAELFILHPCDNQSNSPPVPEAPFPAAEFLTGFPPFCAVQHKMENKSLVPFRQDG